MNDTLVMDIQELDPEKWHMSSKQRMEKSTKYDNANLKHIGNYWGRFQIKTWKISI